MLSLRDTASMEVALQAPLDLPLQELIALRMAQLGQHADCDLGELVQFLVVEPGDNPDDIEAELGFSILRNIIDDSRFGEPDFTPSFEWIKDHGRWFELVYLLSDNGYGVVIFVPDDPGVEFDLHMFASSTQAGRTERTPQVGRRAAASQSPMMLSDSRPERRSDHAFLGHHLDPMSYPERDASGVAVSASRSCPLRLVGGIFSAPRDVRAFRLFPDLGVDRTAAVGLSGVRRGARLELGRPLRSALRARVIQARRPRSFEWHIKSLSSRPNMLRAFHVKNIVEH